MSRRLILFVFSVAGLGLGAGCGTLGSTPSRLPPETNRLRPDHAPTPFSAAEIREHCPTGRFSTYRLDFATGNSLVRRTTFVETRDDEATYETAVLGRDGNPIGAGSRGTETWTALQEHASFPEASVEIIPTRTTTPAGDFDCWLYVVTDWEENGEPTITRLWFARDLPGPPVYMETLKSETVTFRMALLETGTP